MRGVRWVASRSTGAWNRGYRRSERILQTEFQHRQSDLNQRVGAAAAPTHRLLLGQVPAGDLVDMDSTTAVETRSPEAVAGRVVEQPGRVSG